MTSTWHGWSDFGPPPELAGKGPWEDLAQSFYDGMSYFPSFPSPRFEQIKRMPEDPFNLTEIELVCHVGTHVDAPLHFVGDGPDIDQVPLERLYGPGVVWRLDVKPFEVVEASALEALEPRIRPGDMVLIDAGWWEMFGTREYDQNYSFSAGAAQWLVDRGAKLLGVDCGTVDLPHESRGPGFNWPVHHTLLSQGVLIAEHLTNLRSLAGKRIEALFLPLKLRGADGAPARVLARALSD